MKPQIRIVLTVVLLLIWNRHSAWSQEIPSVANGKLAAVASVHPMATQAGMDALNSGGNAVDAAIATALTLGVVDGFNSGIGGGCFILIRTPDGTVVAIDAREMAPAAAHRDMFIRDGKADTTLSQVGPLAIGVPGALAGYAEAVERFGKKSLRDLILPAAEIADNGFHVDEQYASLVQGTAKDLMRFPGSKAVFFGDDDAPVAAGELFRQQDLANTYRSIGEQGVEWFYRGAFADSLADWMQANGGLITRADMANYHTVQRIPVETTYRGYTVYGFPPPSSGGVHVAQILNILERFDLQAVNQSSPMESTHLIAEAMKLAFADRAYWLGDPDHADVPRGLIDKGYARELSERIDSARSIAVDSHGVPPLADSDFFEKHTTHIAAADAEGYWVAITTTVNTTFGSKVIVPGLGVVMNNQMDDFAIAPGVPNAFGLVGNEANSVAAGKRPLSSMSPTIICRDGQPVMTVGAAGGPRIITQSLLATIRVLDFDMSLEDAVSTPRFHHQWSPDLLYIESGTDESIVDGLKEKGHKVRMTRTAGISQAIRFDPSTGTFTAVADPRTNGAALAK
ncbi:MAG: gamma-glutamyltransferase [Pirellulaceae bacterium]